MEQLIAEAKRGDRWSCYSAGVRYASGDGVRRNRKEAIAWYRRAARLGMARACHNLGWCYREGRGVPRDRRLALRWYARGAKLGDPESMMEAAARYEALGFPKRAEALYRGAARFEFTDAYYNLGQMLMESGKPARQREALLWFRRAARQWDAEAMLNLGVAYFEGRGVRANPVRAVEWYRAAARRKEPRAYYNLGLCYSNGTGVTASEKRAHAWWQKAARLGHRKALRKIEECKHPDCLAAVEEARRLSTKDRNASK